MYTLCRRFYQCPTLSFHSQSSHPRPTFNGQHLHSFAWELSVALGHLFWSMQSDQKCLEKNALMTGHHPVSGRRWWTNIPAPSLLSWTILRTVFCAVSQRSPVGLSSSCLTHSVPFSFLPFLTFHPPPGSLRTTSKINYFHLHSVLRVCLWGSPD